MFLLSLLLIIFLVPFFIIEPLVNNVFMASDVQVLGVSLLSGDVKTALGIGIAICELGIILFSMIGRMRDTIDDLLRPFLRFAPLAAFFAVFFNTFKPILARLFPIFIDSSEGEVAVSQAVNSSQFTEGVLLTVGALILFMFTNNALRTQRKTVTYVEKE